MFVCVCVTVLVCVRVAAHPPKLKGVWKPRHKAATQHANRLTDPLNWPTNSLIDQPTENKAAQAN